MLFKRKPDEHGHTGSYKERLVSNGHSQKYRIDYDKRFLPVLTFDVFLLLVESYIFIEANEFGWTEFLLGCFVRE